MEFSILPPMVGLIIPDSDAAGPHGSFAVRLMVQQGRIKSKVVDVKGAKYLAFFTFNKYV